jgi:uncharacterized protein YndB with AHSA1/START domain
VTIHKAITVARPPEVAFKVFCDDIGRWWPTSQGYAFNGDRAVAMAIEGRVGGRVYELATDGTEFELGRITAYEPPQVVAFTWRAPTWDVATLVEVRFIAEGTGTRVELDHSGWELEPKARATRDGYDGGWNFVLGQYRADAENT